MVTTAATIEDVSRRSAPSMSELSPIWRRMLRVTWRLHRGGFLSLLAAYIAIAIAIVVESQPTHAAFASFVANSCVSHPLHPSCSTMSNNFAARTDIFTAFVIALNVLPVVVGVFLGAPLVAREFESGTYRFAFTQTISRSRFLLSALTMCAMFVVAGGVVLGFLIESWAHPLEVVGVESAWLPGIFDSTWFTLPAWSLAGLVLGVSIGTIVKRTVVAMVATFAVVGGLVVLSTADILPYLLPAAHNTASRFWVFQALIGAVLCILAVLVIRIVVNRLRRIR
jgi:ABC-type transport system involved in multi-copper enzyme maturation permease subunit